MAERARQEVGVGARQVRRQREHDVGAGLVGHLDRLGPRPRRRRHRRRESRDPVPASTTPGPPPAGRGAGRPPRRPRRRARARRRRSARGSTPRASPALEPLDPRDPLLARQAVQRMVRRIDPAHRRLVGAQRGLLLLLPDRADQPLLLLVELLGREGRRAQHLDERVEQQIGVARKRRARDVHADRIARVRGKGKARGAALEVLGELELRPARGPLHQLAGGDRGDETAVRRAHRGGRPAASPRPRASG